MKNFQVFMQPFARALSLGKMKNMKNLSIALLALILTACRPWNWDAGPNQTEDRTLTTYQSISVYGDIDVVFTNDSTYDVRVVAPEKLLPYIKTTVNNGRLRIEEESNRYASRDAKVYISQNVFDEIYLNGSGDLSGVPLTLSHGVIRHYGSGDIQLNINATELVYEVYGSGDAHLDGMVQFSDLRITGSGDVDARDLITIRSDVKITGSGDAFVNISDTLNATITGSGDIFYWGFPSILNTVTNGSGDVVQMN
jgi:hypothetical protein